MKRVYDIGWSMLLIVLFVACDDIFEENISDDVIMVVSPKDNEAITGNAVTFVWNPLDGADDYKVQVSRQSTSEIVLDSLVSSNSLTVQMQSGSYDWRVRGENFAYTSSYSFPEGFSIESTSDLSTQNVFLSAPSNDFYTKNNTIILSWSRLEAAASYSIQVEKTVGNNTSVALQQDEISSTNYTLDSNILDEDASYKWSIKAVNENSETQFSSRTLFLDTAVPNPPTLTAPNDDDTVSTTVDFSWSLGQDTGTVQSPLNSLLEIATDENFTSIVQSYTLDGGDTAQQHTFSTTGEFYWRVLISDGAGNQSPYSGTRSITVE
ncbi:hypothetical protein [Flagellimonas pacifica]|uniref:Fibronectin type-III domain-containing protein n=1 Tax=Flagellimonas pacifica TaxID=1247520 RepID=A0A285N1T5_9FLAO|nr:hypothetical protein [Allomuricauda parva]SNZ01701.1 hypothetical protein SAMN06265377_3543 [Allomuricauda parva]